MQPLFFRSYAPSDQNLRKLMLPPPRIPHIETNINVEPIREVNGRVELRALAPKRSTQDLKRDVKNKLDKIDKQTIKTLHTLANEQEGQKS
ncbi:MAG: hypothetical protein EZS28_026035 [Streblomastix strix]|uniref:Uncharacterized protein n=1 Tax=Streblomastix strix TaxID=222440 RepID=A0A5J4V6N9_9EUKA|nr:MAG: hypothetical protein EZS28_026035 [Streblomastix strix]